MKDLTRPPRLLFVCLGNICRSPTAEAVCRHLAAARHLALTVDSAGTYAGHKGELPDARSRAAGERRGYSFAGIKARPVMDSDFGDFDLILAMDRSNLADLVKRCPPQYQHKLSLLLSHGGGAVEEVPDPYYGGTQGFERVLDLIEQSCTALLERIGADQGLVTN